LPPVIVKQTLSFFIKFFFGVRNDIGCEVDLANSPVFHFKKYAHVKFSEICFIKSSAILAIISGGTLIPTL
jgi:hypothetical protein